MPFPENISQYIDKELGEVVAEFTITQRPESGAPEHIKQEWIGLTLPVRAGKLACMDARPRDYFDDLRGELIENTEPVTIFGPEAVQALKDADKLEAAKYWSIHEDQDFIFKASEGELVAIDHGR